MKYRYKQLSRDEINYYHQMLDCFGPAFDEKEVYNKNRPDEAYIRQLLGNDSFVAIVAIENEKVIGALTAYVLQKYEQQRSEIYIYDLAVSQEHRRRGVATSLIETLRPIAVDKGAWVIVIQADYGDEPAVKLYTKLGSKEQVFHFDIPVTVDVETA